MPPCPYCLRIMVKRHPSLQPTRDHILPQSQGGRAIVICCLDCNRIKADLLPLAWSAFMLANPEWWRLTRLDIRRRKRLLIVAEDTPPLAVVPLPIRRVRQGYPKAKPPVVPPELIWSGIPLACLVGPADEFAQSAEGTTLDPDDRQDQDGGRLGIDSRVGP